MIFSQFLKNDDFSVFLDKKAQLPGTNWSNELQQSMKSSNHVLAFFTEDYVARMEQGNANGQNCIIEELKLALKDKKANPKILAINLKLYKITCI
ncbi:toll/interleukin-1 receptor domain-containing protein [Shewanella electrodiphila]|uniref:Toll/interleukin-1 receptor domain-containing protein n=1 Tax=Shewanella electrodiphila TaxID=934143 RepID=A0ABT0KSP7_9GAMM|nr:toll/interleukin-1 receptor domain-containing protein [Shewanella electrodiphila]MCL1046852.1 toll/interleukin-1 receptor domain-containing protein [Shewanella electrodiphila]